MIQVPEHILTLIEKHLKGEQSPADTTALQQWRLENNAHETVYRQLTKIWQETGTILEERDYDLEKAWSKVALRVNKPTPVIRIMPRLAIAASVAGILFFAGWLLFNKKEPQPVQVSALEANKNIILPDGTQILLRLGSTISYPDKFTGPNRNVELTGEAYFNVHHDQAHPFRIQTKRATVEVLGTSFQLNSNKQNDQLVVITGKVLFTNKAATNIQHVFLANQSGKLDEKGIVIDTATNRNRFSWQTGILEFDNTPIDQVAAALADHYNLTVITDSALLQQKNNRTITATFKKQSLNNVLNEIKLLVNVVSKQQHDTLILYKQ